MKKSAETTAVSHRKEAELRAAEKKKREAERARIDAERKAGQAKQLAELRKAREEARRAKAALAAAEAKRKEALKAAELARLEKEKAREEAEAAKKTQVASLQTPGPLSPDNAKPELSGEPLVRKIQQELKRVGCDPGKIDGKWGRKGRQALAEFKRRTKAKDLTDEPSLKVVAALKARKSRVCPVSEREVQPRKPRSKTEPLSKQRNAPNRVKRASRRKKKCITFSQCAGNFDNTYGDYYIFTECAKYPKTCP